jgi:hypothetical protein
VHCMADGTWCSDPVQHSIWAQFTVPDSGSFEISTVHNGTYINTQMAIWYAADCSDPSTFVLLASNDDYWGDAENISCNANPPGCVNQASAAYLNVIQTYPACCENGWDDACQALYDSQNSSCSIPVDCAYVLKGFDSYGDGWNDCQVVVTIAGETTNYTFTEGSTAEWNIPFADGDDVSLSFIAAGWPEEVSIQLISPFNEVLFEGPLVNLGIDFYSTIASCSPPIYQHPQSSRCFVNCLPAGATCFIQLDGFNNETGDIVLSVEPFSGTPSILTLSQDLTCPPAVGVTPESYIITHIEGWGLNHSAQWTGPNDYSSQDYHISELMPGNYQVTFTNACQGQLTTEVEISGPQPYQITHSSMPSCFESTDGSIAFSMAGGTAPLSTTWTFPDGTNHTNPPLNQLSPGLYQLHITDANNCSIMAPIEVETLPMPLFSLGEDLVVCQNFAIQLEGPDTMNTYLWSNNTTAQNAIFTHENYPPGIYALSLTVTNELGCHYQDAITLEVQECTSIDKPSTSISAFPNPAHDALYISGTPACLILLDAFGKTVFQNLHPVSNPILDISFLSSGIYFLRCSQTDAQPSFKIFIEH